MLKIRHGKTHNRKQMLDWKKQKPEFYSIHLDEVLDLSSCFQRPAIKLPEILKSIWSKLG
jgi:hypothetical protein